MRRVISKVRLALYATAVLMGISVTGCKDGYEWAEEKPSWLGESIYDELQRRGEFSIFLQMATDLGRDEFLKKTGSVTIFAATDDAYRTYFAKHGIDGNNIDQMQHAKEELQNHLINR